MFTGNSYPGLITAVLRTTVAAAVAKINSAKLLRAINRSATYQSTNTTNKCINKERKRNASTRSDTSLEPRGSIWGRPAAQTPPPPTHCTNARSTVQIFQWAHYCHQRWNVIAQGALVPDGRSVIVRIANWCWVGRHPTHFILPRQHQRINFTSAIKEIDQFFGKIRNEILSPFAKGEATVTTLESK